MLTIPEIDEIAKRATERIAKEFAESGFSNPPVVTHGIARAVLEAAQQSMHPTPPTSLTDIALARAEVILAKRRARKSAGG